MRASVSEKDRLVDLAMGGEQARGAFNVGEQERYRAGRFGSH